jgi:hypothetical protein
MVRHRVVKIGGFFCALLMAATGCQAVVPAGQASKDGGIAEDMSRQLMVKLRTAQDSCDASQIAALASATAQRLDYVRPMSGRACVITQHADTEARLAEGLNRLKRHPSVEWAEVDAVMKALR